VGIDVPLSHEILAPILASYTARDMEEGVDLCRRINRHGGLGHTVSMFSRNEEMIRRFAEVMNAGRILINTPASHGALGATYNGLPPSLTLGCGSGGKNITTDNISARHLLNIQRIARRKESAFIRTDPAEGRD
jgi:acetaldehyde dehydrogenase/alcohol dehydrogenase